MVLPSGDQRGVFSPSGPVVSSINPDPSALIFHIWLTRLFAFQLDSASTYRICRPSGESCGSLTWGTFKTSTSVMGRGAWASDTLMVKMHPTNCEGFNMAAPDQLCEDTISEFIMSPPGTAFSPGRMGLKVGAKRSAARVSFLEFGFERF